jgi:hypothetical protein
MNHQIFMRKPVTAFAAIVAAFVFLGLNVTVCSAQDFPAGVQEVIKLTQAGIGDDVILAQIKNANTTYNLSADQIITLKNDGVSQPVIKALLTSGGTPAPATPPAPAPAPAPAAPAPAVTTVVPAPTTPPPDASAPAVSMDSFQTQLAPYGTWIQVPGLGLCWQPTVAVTDPLWRPYFNDGNWAYTDAGWSWQSDYPWGDTVFHYGRWLFHNGAWIWVPGYDWAPAWVCWREADGYCGWAPLPPGAIYRPGLGLYYNGSLALDVDFGLGMDAFVFVPFDHFWDHNLRLYMLPHDRLGFVFHSSWVANGYRVDHGHFVMEGLGHDHMVGLTHHDYHMDVHNSYYHGGYYDNHGYDNHHHGPGW